MKQYVEIISLCVVILFVYILAWAVIGFNFILPKDEWECTTANNGECVEYKRQEIK